MKLWLLVVAVAVVGLAGAVGCKKEKMPPGTINNIEPSSAVQGDGHKHDDSKKPEMVKDIVCGMMVEKDKAKVFEYRKEKFYFCSDDCLNKFKKEPTKYPTGLSGEPCACRKDMPGCGCGHCKGKDEKCECGKEEKKDGHEDHKH